MNTATAQAKETKHVYTGFELWRIVAEFQISVAPTRLGDGPWVAIWSGNGGQPFTYGQTPEGAVEELLREIGRVDPLMARLQPALNKLDDEAALAAMGEGK